MIHTHRYIHCMWYSCPGIDLECTCLYITHQVNILRLCDNATVLAQQLTHIELVCGTNHSIIGHTVIIFVVITGTTKQHWP